MRPYENETWLITVRKTYYDRLVRDAKGWLKDHHMGGGIAEEMVDKTFDTITLIGRDPGEHLRETVKRRLDRAWREGRNESVPTIPTPSAIADAGWSNPDYAYGPDYERWFELVTRTYESPLKDYAAARAEDLGLAVDEAVTIADAVLAEIKRRGQDVPDDPDEKAPIYWYLRGAVLNACRTEATKSGKRKPLDGGEYSEADEGFAEDSQQRLATAENLLWGLADVVEQRQAIVLYRLRHHPNVSERTILALVREEHLSRRGEKQPLHERDAAQLISSFSFSGSEDNQRRRRARVREREIEQTCGLIAMLSDDDVCDLAKASRELLAQRLSRPPGPRANRLTPRRQEKLLQAYTTANHPLGLAHGASLAGSRARLWKDHFQSHVSLLEVCQRDESDPVETARDAIEIASSYVGPLERMLRSDS